jgi:hypothetical protein
VKQASYFEWVHHHRSNHVATIKVWEIFATDPDDQVNTKCAGFTVAELGEMLPEAVDDAGHTCEFRTTKQAIESVVCYEGRKHLVGGAFVAGNEADARAKMLIYLLENKLITV